MTRVREPWMDDALCAEVGVDFFFPDEGSSTFDAKQICAGCPVREQCLAFGLAEDFGVWGGTTVKQRRSLRRAA